MFIVLLIALVGTASILYFSLSGLSKTNSKQATKSPRIPPKAKYISSISNYGDQSLKIPMGVAVVDGALYVTDSGNGRVVILSQTGLFKRSINLSPKPELSYPVGITIDQQRRIYLASPGMENQIAVYDSAGEFLYNFPKDASSQASTSDTPGKPIGLCIANERLYVTDVLDQDVKVYDLTGKLILKFGRPGNKDGEFSFPNGITVDKAGNIYVSDSNNGRVQVFDNKGEFLYLFAGSEKDLLALPRGIALDKRGRLHVVDMLKHKVFVFTKKGRSLFSYGSFGSRSDNFSSPNGIAIDGKTGNAFIADKMNNRISIWK